MRQTTMAIRNYLHIPFSAFLPALCPNSQNSSRQRLALRQLAWVALLAVWAVLLLGGCGPGASGSGESDLRRATQEIARAYLADGDLDKARTALDALQAANPRQWLVLVTEEAIGANDDPETTLALAKLATALKLQSGLINDFAARNGLIAAQPTALPAVATVALAPTPAPCPTATPALAVAASESAAAAAAGDTTVTTTGIVSSTAASVAAVALATPTASADNSPKAAATGLINVRSGPGVEYPVANTLDATQPVPITGKNATGDWWEVTLADGSSGWVLGQLVTASGDLAAVAVAADIPTPPPTTEPATAVAAAPVEAQPTAAAPASQPDATEAPAATRDHFPRCTAPFHAWWPTACGAKRRTAPALVGTFCTFTSSMPTVCGINGVRLQGHLYGRGFRHWRTRQRRWRDRIRSLRLRRRLPCHSE